MLSGCTCPDGYTCCGLAILLGDKKFLAHLDTSMKNKIPCM